MQIGRTQTFMILIAIIGIVLVAVATHIDQQIDECTAKNLRNANRFCLIFGTAITSIALTLFIDQRRRGVKSSPDGSRTPPVVYSMLLIMLGFCVTVLGSVIRADSDKDKCGVTGSASLLIIFGIGAILTPIAYHFAPKSWFSKSG